MLTQEKQRNLRLILVVGLSALVPFLFLGQSDVAHTVFSSYSILHGHFFDFYDFNKIAFVGNDYLPLVYLVFAVWMSPLFLLGITTEPTQFDLFQLNSVELLWVKSGLTIVLILSAATLNRISKRIWGETSLVPSGWLFVSSPITFLAVFTLAQFDVLGLLFALLGLERWLKRDEKRFVSFFAIAICFKYFSLLIFLTLILLGRGRVKEKFSQAFLGILLVSLQVVVFSTNEAFRENIFSQANRVLSLDSPLAAASKFLVFIVVAAISLLWSQRRKEISEQLNDQLVISTIILVLSVFFILVKWNPQWLIYLVPFWALALNYVRQSKLFAAIELIGFIGLIFMLANIWTNNLDESMAQKGILAFAIPERVLRLTDIYAPHLLPIGIAAVYLSLVLLACIAILDYRKSRSSGEIASSKLFKIPVISSFVFVSALAIPILACYTVPVQAAKQLSQNVQYNNLGREALGQFHSKVLNIPVGKSVNQSIPFKQVSGSPRPQAIEFDMYIEGKASVDIRVSQGERIIGSRLVTFSSRNPNSFPGFGGWTTVTVPIRLQETSETAPEIEIMAIEGQDMGVWLDTERPEKVNLTDGYGKLVSGSITSRLLK